MQNARYSILCILTLALISCSDRGTDSNPTFFDVSVSVTPAGAGTIAPAADSSYQAGSTISLHATPADGFKFTGWSGDVESSENPLSLTVDQDYSLTANFIDTDELFYLAENGVTIRCPEADPGQTGMVNGTGYEAVGRGLLDQKLADGADLSTVCTTPVTDLGSMFAGAENFNQDISSWNVSNVTNMRRMFFDASSFNQDLSGWCVQNIDEEPNDFSEGSALTEQHHPVWGTCPQ